MTTIPGPGARKSDKTKEQLQLSDIEIKSLPMRQKIIEKEIRKTIQKPKGKLTKADMAKVRYLNIDWSKYDISDWNLISELTKLEGLKVNHQVDCLMPLSDLKNLSFLFLESGRAENLEPLANLSKLRCLSLIQSGIEDLSPLAGLRELEMLRLDWNDLLYDIKPLSGLENLKFLSLADTRVADLSPLTGLKQLKAIYLQDYDYGYEAGKDSVSESDINNFQKSLPGCHIAHNYLWCHDA